METKLVKKAAVIGTICTLLFAGFLPVISSEKSIDLQTFFSNAPKQNTKLIINQLIIQNRIFPFDDEPWWNSDWFYRKQITIDHTQVLDNLTDFPILVFLDSDSNLATYAQTDGGDIIFINDDGIKLNHEIEYYNGSNGQLICWVNVTSISSVNDTLLWMYYGNPLCCNQQNIIGTWNEHYVGVWHCAEDPGIGGIGDVKDSTKYFNNGTAINMEEEDKTDGIVGSSYLFDGVNEKILVYDSKNGSLDLLNAFTLECWWNAVDLSGGFNAFMGKRGSGTLSYQYEYRIRDTLTTNAYSLLTTGGSVDDNTSQKEGYWFYGSTTWNDTTVVLYHNGTQVNSFENKSLVHQNANFGFGSAGEYQNPWDGYLDEIRVSNIQHSAAWIQTTYNTINSPSSFFDVGIHQIYDSDPPEITNIIANPNPQIISGYVNISCKVTDNIGVNQVLLNITYPDTSEHEEMMMGSYYYNTTYTQQGTYSYFIFADDVNGNSNISAINTFSIINTPPVAVDDYESVDEDASTGEFDVLDNDYDPDGHPLQIITVTQPTHGISSTNGTHVFYTPFPDFNGLDPFTYTITDNNGGTDTGTVYMIVKPINDPPIANDDSANVPLNYQNYKIDVLANDTDIDGDSLNITNVSTALHGSTSFDALYVYYTPDPNYDGPDEFTYTIDDGNNGTAIGTVAIMVMQNFAPLKPTRPEGPTRGRAGTAYEYTTATTDPENEQIYYNWSWGDGTYSGWIGPIESGHETIAEHTWSEQGNYEIKVKAKDINGFESNWSQPLPVSMPHLRNHISIRSSLQTTFTHLLTQTTKIQLNNRLGDPIWDHHLSIYGYHPFLAIIYLLLHTIGRNIAG